ncbi:MAG: hypothetical protein H7236_11530 [Gemmatimonadaceae bacterium]|nr:hypothetical protein [Caulobacter sp.]
MLLILSLFLVCTVLVPVIGEVVRRHNRMILKRKQLEILLREGDVAEYWLD